WHSRSGDDAGGDLASLWATFTGAPAVAGLLLGGLAGGRGRTLALGAGTSGEGPPSGAVIASDPVTSSRFWAPRPKRSVGRHAAVYRVGCLVRRARFGCTEPNCRLGRTRKTMLPSRLWSGLRRFAEVELV